jgi:hypothetical protein
MAEGARTAAHPHSGRARLKVSPDRWRRVEPLLSEALDMATGEREEWLAGLDERQPEVAPLLRRLLAAHERAERSGELDRVLPLEPRAATASLHAAWARSGSPARWTAA